MNTWTKYKNSWAVKCDAVQFAGCTIEVVNKRNEKKVVTINTMVTKDVAIVDNAFEVKVSHHLVNSMVFAKGDRGKAVAMRFSKAVNVCDYIELTSEDGVCDKYLVCKQLGDSLYLVGLVSSYDTKEVFEEEEDKEALEVKEEEEYQRQLSK